MKTTTKTPPLPPSSSSSQQPSSTLANIAEHAELRLVRILSSGAPPTLLSPTFESDCESHIANADAPGLIRTIILDRGALTSLFSISPVEDCISAFSLLAALLDRVGGGRGGSDGGKEEILSNELADAVSAEGFDPVKRVAMLSALYNLRSRGAEKCRLLGRIVSLCAECEVEKLMDGGALYDVLAVGNVLRLCDGWGVGVPERRVLYRAIGGAYKNVKGGEVRRQRYLLLDVKSYEGGAGVDDEAIVAAREATVAAVRDPVTLFGEQRGMLTLPAVAALKKNAATKSLHSLLEIFQKGKLTDLQSLLKSRPELISANSLSEQSLIHNMRLLSLCSLASEHEEIPYSAIAQTLQISLDDVESWVIAAVSADLISAKMDQLSQVVMVERCAVRTFGMEDWRRLKTRLDFWKTNVRTVLEGLSNARAVPGGI
eukprot:CAMPEP_0172493598 /NCGR_PEP_ID=MMETSP1066-20121228/25016_1 /TAXON_ID=671091 /ORGANISM="Coscinodiscus wailesii, Strain CCMP2513" /LENGTH=429 /DNA_ID=CAMNT_0013263821 /DNA_START=134 /DNA_END=1423 /DNA_ORIENTATION=-